MTRSLTRGKLKTKFSPIFYCWRGRLLRKYYFDDHLNNSSFREVVFKENVLYQVLMNGARAFISKKIYQCLWRCEIQQVGFHRSIQIYGVSVGMTDNDDFDLKEDFCLVVRAAVAVKVRRCWHTVTCLGGCCRKIGNLLEGTSFRWTVSGLSGLMDAINRRSDCHANVWIRFYGGLKINTEVTPWVRLTT